jgi:hypothetical protein
MTFRRQFVTVLLASTLMLSVGCEKKKPKLPSQAKAPTEPVSLPAQISEEAPPVIATETPQPPPHKDTPAPALPKRKVKKKPAIPPPSSQPANTTAGAGSGSGNTTIATARPPGNPAGEGTPDVAIAADVTSAQLTRQKQSTAQLLDETEKTVNGLKGLSREEEEMLAQIRTYVNQSRKATSDGDFERAYNLANKAHLLSDALVKK